MTDEKSRGHMDSESLEKHGEGHDEGGHLSVKFYVMIGLTLAIITAVEVAVYYIPAMSAVETPLILALTTAKFALVVMFFMHLWIDSKVFTWLFGVGLLLASLMVAALIVLYHFLPRFAL
jgi:cytochrome c oxidase subunit IV